MPAAARSDYVEGFRLGLVYLPEALCHRGLIVVISYYFQIWNKKEHDIIISRVIRSHIGPVYIETLCT